MLWYSHILLEVKFEFGGSVFEKRVIKNLITADPLFRVLFDQVVNKWDSILGDILGVLQDGLFNLG